MEAGRFKVSGRSDEFLRIGEGYLNGFYFKSVLSSLVLNSSTSFDANELEELRLAEHVFFLKLFRKRRVISIAPVDRSEVTLYTPVDLR